MIYKQTYYCKHNPFNTSHEALPMKAFFFPNEKQGEWEPNDIPCSEASLSYGLFEEVQRATFCWKWRKSLSSSEKQLVFFGLRKSPLPRVLFIHHSQPSTASGRVAFTVPAQHPFHLETLREKTDLCHGSRSQIRHDTLGRISYHITRGEPKWKCSSVTTLISVLTTATMSPRPSLWDSPRHQTASERSVSLFQDVLKFTTCVFLRSLVIWKWVWLHTLFTHFLSNFLLWSWLSALLGRLKALAPPFQAQRFCY